MRNDPRRFRPDAPTVSRPLELPGDAPYEVMTHGSGKQEVATTMAFVRLLKELLKDPALGPRFVPIIPDEARTFGMDAMFPVQKIYNPAGQKYQAVDRDMFLSYKESTTGQILHEGIDEAGSLSSFLAAGSSYSTHDEPMIPIYVFYSMFGFQRTGDQFWVAMDQKVRGFALGATAGRTTLNGEGLQHQDGQSLLYAAQPDLYRLRPGLRLRTDPSCGMACGGCTDRTRGRLLLPHPLQRALCPASATRRRGRGGHPAGMHLIAPAVSPAGPVPQLLASGVGVPWALKASSCSVMTGRCPQMSGRSHRGTSFDETGSKLIVSTSPAQTNRDVLPT